MASAVLKRAELVELLGCCYTTIFNMERAGKFPARRKLSAGRVGWLRSEVEAWIESRERVHDTAQEREAA